VEPVTVVIPTIGRKELNRAIESVHCQTLRPAELIIVDNSRDQAVVGGIATDKPLGEIRVRIITAPPLSGPAASRNIGAWAANSEYVAFLDDDDAFAPAYLERMAQAIGSYHPDVLYGRLVMHGDGEEVRGEYFLGSISIQEWFLLLYQHDPPHPGGQNVVVRRKPFFELGGFPIHLRRSNDRAFALAAIKAGLRILSVDEAAVHCYPVEGYRATTTEKRWLPMLDIISTYWPDVGWGSRFRAVRRLIRHIASTYVVRGLSERLRRAKV
jgi:glycosyltransferase involved in cell wall biosynthesis